MVAVHPWLTFTPIVSTLSLPSHHNKLYSKAGGYSIWLHSDDLVELNNKLGSLDRSTFWPTGLYSKTSGYSLWHYKKLNNNLGSLERSTFWQIILNLKAWVSVVLKKMDTLWARQSTKRAGAHWLQLWSRNWNNKLGSLAWSAFYPNNKLDSKRAGTPSDFR